MRLGAPDPEGLTMLSNSARGRARSRAEMRELDRRAIEEYGIPAAILMENAGRACALELLAWPELELGPCVVVCGCGNNGGDGLVIARTLHNHGRRVRVFVVGDEAGLARASAEVQLNLRLWRGLMEPVQFIDQQTEQEWLAREFSAASVLVDALFGSGLTREVGEPCARVMRTMNAAQKPILAVDMPSGIDCDTGEVLGTALRVAMTMSLVAPKLGQLLGRGPEHCGAIKVAEIGIPFCILGGP